MIHAKVQCVVVQRATFDHHTTTRKHIAKTLALELPVWFPYA